MDTIISLHQQMAAIQTLAEVEQVAAAITALYSDLYQKKSAWKASYVPPKKKRSVTKANLGVTGPVGGGRGPSL